MSKKRTNFTAEFKAKLVLEVLEGVKSISEIASQHEVLPANLKNWKNQFIDNMSLAFDKSTVVKEYKTKIDTLELNNQKLAQKVGNLTMEKDFLEGKLVSSVSSDKRKAMVGSGHPLSLLKQCKLLQINRTGLYYSPTPFFSTLEDIKLLDAIDEIFTESPCYGYRRMHQQLIKDGFSIGEERVAKAMKHIGIRAIYPKPKTTMANKEHKKYPYLLANFKNDKNQVVIDNVNQVWSTDITYIKLEKGFAYLAAVIDWNSKHILSWKLSNTMDVSLTTGVLQKALDNYPKPEIFNTDQGSQYTAKKHVKILTDNQISISMDGKGRSIDNIVIERFWRTLKYEDVYLKGYETLREASKGIGKFIDYYNNRRLHSSVGYQTPSEAYQAAA